MLNLVANGPSGYNLTNSLRFRASASGYLSRTPASASNRQVWTWSGWIKRGSSFGSDQAIFSVAGSTNTTYFLLKFDSNNCIYVGNYSTNFFITTQVFRDPSAWYHIVLTLDTTQATANNRLKLYVNGSQVTAFSSNNIAAQIAQNSDQGINAAAAHNICREALGGVFLLDAYQTEINFIDGQALTPSSFGNTNATTGVWQPAKYTGTYGTNGFYLKFSDIALTSGSNAGLGKDFSGNTNYWTTNNISVTAGTTYDAMTDVPTNTSATVANYAVLNPLSYVGSPTFSNANLTESGTLDRLVKATIGITSGKWYWECVQTAGTNSMFGLATIDSTNTFCGGGTTSWGYYGGAGTKWNNNSGSAYGSSFTTNDVIGVAFDADAGTLTFYKNNTSQGTAFTGLTGNTYTPAAGNGSNTNAFNFGQRPFQYSAPSGFLPLNTYNLA